MSNENKKEINENFSKYFNVPIDLVSPDAITNRFKIYLFIFVKLLSVLILLF
jgi:hypothetical protein